MVTRGFDVALAAGAPSDFAVAHDATNATLVMIAAVTAGLVHRSGFLMAGNMARGGRTFHLTGFAHERTHSPE
jgi:hypothetical protein